MDTIRFELDASTIDRSRVSGLVTAGIWLRTSRLDFPATGWNDFAVLILSAWADASLRLRRNEARSSRVDFMDGPYHVEISLAAPDKWRLALVKTRQSGRTQSELTVESDRLIESLAETSATLLAICEQRGWKTRDSDRLAGLVPLLRDEARGSKHG